MKQSMSETLINQKYSALASKLGELYFKRSGLDKQIETIVAEIDALNKLMPQMQQIEQIVEQRAAQAQAEKVMTQAPNVQEMPVHPIAKPTRKPKA